MWTLFLAPPAFAEEAPPSEDVPPSEDASKPCENDGCGGKKEKRPMRHDLTGEIYVQALADGATALGGGAELVQGLGFLEVDARGESYQHWIGRATIGIDAFPRSRFDLTFGVFAGSVGHVIEIDDDGIEATHWRFSPTIGTEFGIGSGFGPVTFRWEHAQGGGDERFSEDSTRIGFDIVKRRFNVFGQLVYFDPESDPGVAGFGFGAALRI